MLNITGVTYTLACGHQSDQLNRVEFCRACAERYPYLSINFDVCTCEHPLVSADRLYCTTCEKPLEGEDEYQAKLAEDRAVDSAIAATDDMACAS